jgi:hypothetical protein
VTLKTGATAKLRVRARRTQDGRLLCFVDMRGDPIVFLFPLPKTHGSLVRVGKTGRNFFTGRFVGWSGTFTTKG